MEKTKKKNLTLIPDEGSSNGPAGFLTPETLEAYDQIVPGSAHEILSAWQEEVTHRRRIEARGQTFAFALALVCVVGSFGLIVSGFGIEGISLVFGAIAGLVAVFVYGKRNPRENRE